MRFAAVLFSFAAVVAAGCGGGGKKDNTTPTGGGGSGQQSMQNTDPTGGGTSTSGGTTPGTPSGGGTSAGDGTTNGGSTTAPPIIPPNLDSDPAASKAQVDAHLSIAKAALAQNPPDGDKALAEARAALAIDAANVDAAAYVAYAYYHKKLYDTAELVLDDLFKREAAKQNANVYYVYGLVYDHTNRADRARLAYEKAVQINPQHASALVNLGVHQLKNSQYAEAQQTFERLTQQFNRNDAITLTSLGSAYRGRSADFPSGSPDRDQFVRTAEKSYKAALQANGSYGPAYYNLGLLYLDTDPYPGISDPLTRVNAAKAFFEQYKNMPGVDIKLFDARMKDVDKLVKKIQRDQKKKKK
jgi:tetratricopeptide (TPR) repeat protein